MAYLLFDNMVFLPKQKKMLEHQKKILLGLQNNEDLFQKEFFKSFKWLSPKEASLLLKWVEDNFSDLYNSVIIDFLKKDQYPMY